MKGLLYILIFQFSSGACIPKTDFSQLTKLSFLIEHYQLHVEEAKLLGESFDVFDFVYLHYINTDEHVPMDNHNHEDLPFKSLGISTGFIVESPQSLSSEVEIEYFESNFHYSGLKDALLSINIFHPPLV